MGEPRPKARLEDVLQANGEAQLMDRILGLSVNLTEQPSMIFGWQHVGPFVDAIHAARAAAVELPRCPLELPLEVTVESFKVAVLAFLQADKDRARVGTSCLPCSMAGAIRVGGMMSVLDQDPWVQRIVAVGGADAVTPIPCVYIPETKTLMSVVERRSGALWA